MIDTTKKSPCRGLGAEFVKIESQAETEFINVTFLASRKMMWIGLTDIVNEGYWKWSDGSSLRGYTNWENNQPNNIRGNQQCVAIIGPSEMISPVPETSFIFVKKKKEIIVAILVG